ncbi:reverse transcriptase domain-containing protein [Tanacetum coccineum]|uniref:Reverse transcriptase domain-containing protein n=1 Tax=Tanacetum coccineum TaxID=301880 RepID=A0ABQ5IY18_9ASTR
MLRCVGLCWTNYVIRENFTWDLANACGSRAVVRKHATRLRSQEFIVRDNWEHYGKADPQKLVYKEGKREKAGWVDELPNVLWAHRTSIKQSNGETPFSLTYRSEAVIPAEIGMPSYRTLMIREEFNEEEQRLNLDLLQEQREAAAIREARYKSKMEQYYNKKVRPAGFRPGEFVYRRNEASRVEDQGKLGPKWEGPYRVTEAFENGSYKLQTMEDKIVPRTWHAINLRKCYL